MSEEQEKVDSKITEEQVNSLCQESIEEGLAENVASNNNISLHQIASYIAGQIQTPGLSVNRERPITIKLAPDWQQMSETEFLTNVIEPAIDLINSMIDTDIQEATMMGVPNPVLCFAPMKYNETTFSININGKTVNVSFDNTKDGQFLRIHLLYRVIAGLK